MTTIRKAYADVSGGQIHYRHRSGEGDAVLFFHRTPISSASYAAVLRDMPGTRPLYAFDTPGFGESFVPPEGSDMAQFRDWFIEAIDGLGIDRFHLVGHHTGSHFAVDIAAHLPERALSLMLDGAMYHTPEERAAAQASPPPPMAEIRRDGQYARATWDFLEPYYTVFDGPTINDEYVGALRTTFTRHICLGALRSHDYRGSLAQVQCPVLACAAEDDVFVGHLDRIAGDFPHVRIARYDAAGIAAPELQTGRFCEMVLSSIG